MRDKKKVIEQSAIEMLRRLEHLNVTDRYVLFEEWGHFWFDDDPEDELFIPNWEEVQHEG